MRTRKSEKSSMKPATAGHLHIAIVGSGFAGIGCAIRLRQRGIHDFAIFERASDLGGTWRDNSYPGCACDVESHLYSFSFAPNPNWSRSFSPQPEIFAYLRRCAVEHGVLDHMRFGHTLLDARWDETNARWNIFTSAGVYTADILISGMGALCEPAVPNIAGLDTFAGTMFHSARWDHDYDLAGKRVAVIGTGASAIQFVPEIQRKVSALKLFQRTPAWVVPRRDRAVSALEKLAFRTLPLLHKAVRAGIYARRELMVVGFRHPPVMRVVERFARAYLEHTVTSPELRKKLTPNFRIGCKRVLISSEYLPALTQPNVEVITDGIREVTPNGVVTADGVLHEVDAIILGTGFHVSDVPYAPHIHGRDGKSLADTWQGSPKAHLGTMVHGYPNLFLLLGPNTGLGHTSVVIMVESQIELALDAIEHMHKRRLATLEPSADAQAKFVTNVQKNMEGTVWTSGGCSSWYLDETGRNSVLWPSFTFSFMKQARFRPQQYETRPLPRGESHV